MMRGRSMCDVCVHWQGELNDDGEGLCAAFPAGIPQELLMGKVDHRQPLPGDNGVRFEPDPDERPGIVAETLERYA